MAFGLACSIQKLAAQYPNRVSAPFDGKAPLNLLLLPLDNIIPVINTVIPPSRHQAIRTLRSCSYPTRCRSVRKLSRSLIKNVRCISHVLQWRPGARFQPDPFPLLPRMVSFSSLSKTKASGERRQKKRTATKSTKFKTNISHFTAPTYSTQKKTATLTPSCSPAERVTSASPPPPPAYTKTNSTTK